MAIVKYAKSCSKNVGGNSLLAIAEVANITAVTVTTGEVSAITGTNLPYFRASTPLIKR